MKEYQFHNSVAYLRSSQRSVMDLLREHNERLKAGN